MQEKLKMFYHYLETFNIHHAKHLGRLFKKTKMIVRIISDDMPLDDSGQTDDAPASNPDDATDNVEFPGDYSENIENDETELDILNRNKLDNSGDVTKFVKSVVAADNISFITKT